ncbi:MAG: phospho-N-acetylmuramoyl-pentapeptide-transferase [Leptospiraceae bacterium]|nr:phospho-N-acetylmuramoyl-pentapeptide-transferase [Leptospiraceae bacterium]
MLYWLLYPLKDEVSFFRIFGYTTFRMVFAAVTALLLSYYFGPKFIQFLKKLKYGESIRDDGPQSHLQKAGTPTIGGLMIIAIMSISLVIWGNFSNLYVVGIWIGTLALAGVGFWDDYQKSVLKIPGGMKPRVKLVLQFLIGLTFAIVVYYFPYNPSSLPNQHTDLFIPFLKDPAFNLGLWAIFFWMFIVVGTSNAVNLTDGLDGLAVGISIIVLGTLGILAYVTGVKPLAEYLLIPFIPEANEVGVFLAALVGACIGFLWYNAYPAQIFMGDTGSLALGGAIGMTSILIRRELLLIILGGIFVLEAISVILQVGSYKLRKKRIFKMAPIHHHFELSGWHENKVVIRFWISGILLALVSLSSLKIL